MKKGHRKRTWKVHLFSSNDFSPYFFYNKFENSLTKLGIKEKRTKIGFVTRSRAVQLGVAVSSTKDLNDTGFVFNYRPWPKECIDGSQRYCSVNAAWYISEFKSSSLLIIIH